MSRAFHILLFLGLYLIGNSSYAESNKVDSLKAFDYYNLAKKHAGIGAIDSARSYMLLSANEYKNAQQWDRFFDAVHQVAFLYNHQYRYQDAVDLLDSIDHIYYDKFQPEFRSAINYLGVHAWPNLQLANYSEADEWLQQTAEVLDKNMYTVPDNYLWTYYYQSVLYSRIGLNDLSLKYLNKTKAVGKKYNNNSYLGSVYNLKGIINRRIGEYEKALEYYKLGYKLESQSKSKANLTPYNNNFGVIYHHLGQDSIALAYLQGGLAALVDYSSDYYSVESTLRNTMATIMIDLGKFDSAKLILDKNLAREYKNYHEYGFHSAETLMNLGLLENKRGNFTSADQYYAQVKEIVTEKLGENSPRLGQLYRKIGANKSDLGQYDQALLVYQKALKLVAPGFSDLADSNPVLDDNILDRLETLNILQAKAKALTQRYLLATNTDDLNLAIETNQLAIALFNQIRDNLYYGESKQVLSSLMKPLFEQSIQLAMIENDVSDQYQEIMNRILLAMEASKSYVLSAALQQSLLEGEKVLPDSITGQQDRLSLQIENLRFYRNNLLAKSRVDSIALMDNEQALLEAYEAYEEFKSALNQTYPQYNQTRYGQSKLSIDELKSSLEHDAVLIEYFAGEENLYALAVTDAGVKAYNLGQYDSIEIMARDFSNFTPSMSPKTFQAASYTLYQNLLAPLLAGLEKQNIIVIPDGIIGYLPFDALIDAPVDEPSFESLNYLVNKYSFHEHYLASLYFTHGKNSSTGGSFIGYAPDFSGEQIALLASRNSGSTIGSAGLTELPFAKTEVENISRLLKGEAIIGTLASEANFKANAGSFNYLHVASHSLLNTTSPLFSMLVFAKNSADSTQDGFLHAYELYGMNLPNELVTLSACNTGIGQYQNGEGIMSLARGFIYAGASNVLMSLWEVADQSTAEIMQTFYEEIYQGTTKHSALRKAKLDYLKTADNITANPYYWAGFTLLGPQEKASNMMYWPMATVFIVLMAVFARRRKKKSVEVGE